MAQRATWLGNDETHYVSLSYRMQAWLAFGEEYDIFTQRTDTMDSSVTFVYKVASIGG